MRGNIVPQLFTDEHYERLCALAERGPQTQAEFTTPRTIGLTYTTGETSLVVRDGDNSFSDNFGRSWDDVFPW